MSAVTLAMAQVGAAGLGEASTLLPDAGDPRPGRDLSCCIKPASVVRFCAPTPGRAYGVRSNWLATLRGGLR